MLKSLRALPLVFSTLIGAASSAQAGGCVALLHGLARTENSMWLMERELSNVGYDVINKSYPSTIAEVSELSENAIGPILENCHAPVHFVTHSMGGILVRDWVSRHGIDGIGRVVMLSPPNQGSDLVDKLKDVPGFGMINGPAGMQLGKEPGSLPARLGAYPGELGIIAGTRSLNPIYSSMLPGTDDGKVAVDDMKVEGMTDWVEIGTSHTFMMMRPEVIRQTIRFLDTGAFKK